MQKYINQLKNIVYSSKTRDIALTGVLILSGILLFVQPPVETPAPASFDIITIHRFFYLTGIPYNSVYGFIMAGLLLVWIMAVVRAFPQWKKQIFLKQHDTWAAHQHEPIYLKEYFDVAHDLEFSAHRIRKELITRGFYVREEQTGNEIYIKAEKHRINLWGTILLHTGIALILVGVCVLGTRGIREDMRVTMNQWAQMLSKPFMVMLNHMDIRWYPNTKHVATNTAQITVLNSENGRQESIFITAGKATMENGIRYHMLDFGDTLRDVIVEVNITGKRERSRRIRLSFGEDVLIENTPWLLRLEQFTPDFAVYNGKVISRSAVWQNPAILVSVFCRRVFSFKQWFFQKHETHPFIEHKKPLVIKLVELNPGQYIDLRSISNEMMYMLWAGSVCMVAGLAVMYFFAYRVIWLSIQETVDHATVTIAGESIRDYVNFPAYFKRLVAILKKE